MTDVDAEPAIAAAPDSGDPVFMRRLRKSPLQRGLTIAVLDAMVVAGMSVVLETWFVPFLQVRIGGSAQLIGWLTIAPMLIAGLLGPVTSPIITFMGGNKRTSLLSCWIQILGLGLMAFPLWMPQETWTKPVAVGLCITVIGFGAVGAPAFTALLGGMIPRRICGRYHTGRMRLWTLMKLVFAALLAVIIDRWKVADTAVGMQLVIGIGCACRLGSWALIRRIPEIPVKVRSTSSTTGRMAIQEARDFMSFLRSMPRTDLGRWTLVWAALCGGCSIAGPYFIFYWLLDTDKGGLGLKNHAWLYSSLVYTSTVTRLICYPVCGRLVDRFGSGAILRVAVAGITLVPFFHAMTTNMPFLIMAEVFSGFVWCMAESAVGVLLFSCSHDELHRARLIGYHQSVCCFVVVFFAWLGGALIHVLPELNGSVYRMLFLVSMIARMPAVFLAIRMLPPLKGEAQVRGLWRHIPGAVPTITLGRGVMRAFRE